MADNEVELIDKKLLMLMDEIQDLRRKKFILLLENRKCIVCGVTEDHHYNKLGMGPLIDIRVILSDGEEGHADEIRYFCNDHMIEFAALLNRWGYVPEDPGGINFLNNGGEDEV